MLGKVRSIGLPVVALIAVIAAPPTLASLSADAAVAEQATEVVESRLAALADGLATAGAQGNTELEAIISFYQTRNFQPLWVSDSGLSTRGDDLLIALMDMQRLGIRQLNLEQLMADLESGSIGLAAAEFELSWRLLSLGRLLTKNLSEQAEPYDAEFYANQSLMAEIGAFEQPSQLIRTWEPRHPDYLGLKHALTRYEKFAANPWPKVVARKRFIRPGYKGSEVPVLRARLKAEGYLLSDSNSLVYDSELVDQVIRFQQQHVLKSKGVIGPATVTALNVPATQRMVQIRHSMARLFALPNKLGDRYVWVNIPAYKMAVYEDQQTLLSMNVVVGKPKHATPEMVDVMESIEFNPYWNVPTSITREELIPAVQNDESWLARNKVDVLNWHNDKAFGSPVDWATVADEPNLPFRLRQQPGKRNPLGQVKFMFPNEHAVYMHDTPSKSLFNRNRRAFSHGCVRLAEPMKLAEYVLANHVDASLNINRTLRSGKNTPVELDRPLPVYLSYSTAWVDRENRLHFGADLYKQDHQLPTIATQIFAIQHRKLRSLQLALQQSAESDDRVASLER